MTVTVNFSGLEPITEAINNLAKAFGAPGGPTSALKEHQSVPVQQMITQQPVSQQQTAPPVQQQVPVQQMQQVPMQQQPVQQTAPAVQTTTVTYTSDDLARAAMALMDSGRQQDLIGLLQQFGVTALPDLPPAQYGAFATALRGMGAQI